MWVLVLGACFALLVLGLRAAESWLTVPEWLIKLGGSSYALYLLHVPLQLVLIRGLITLHCPSSVTLPILVAVPVAAALVVHTRFERPVSRWLRQHLLRPSASSIVQKKVGTGFIKIF